MNHAKLPLEFSRRLGIHSQRMNRLLLEKGVVSRQNPRPKKTKPKDCCHFVSGRNSHFVIVLLLFFSPNMHFRLIKVRTDAQFEKMMPNLWESLNNIRNVLRELNFPVKGDGPDAVAKAVEDCKNRLLASLYANPGGHGVQIFDEENENAVVASTYWSFFDDQNNTFLLHPGKQDPEERATWWPFGSEIWRFTVLIEDQSLALKFERLKKLHTY